MSVRIIDSFPSPLYRAFDEEEYAQSFVEQGIFRLRSLLDYRTIENANRKDNNEGIGRAVVYGNRPVINLDNKSQTNEFGPIHISGVSGNSHYILCFSGPQVDRRRLASKYGEHVICISQPNTLVHDIASYLEQSPELHCDAMWLECVEVRYDKGQSIGKLSDLDIHELVTMPFGQKGSWDSSDCEYRLVLTLLTIDSPPKEIRVKLCRRLEYAEFLT